MTCHIIIAFLWGRYPVLILYCPSLWSGQYCHPQTECNKYSMVRKVLYTTTIEYSRKFPFKSKKKAITHTQTNKQANKQIHKYKTGPYLLDGCIIILGGGGMGTDFIPPRFSHILLEGIMIRGCGIFLQPLQ